MRQLAFYFLTFISFASHGQSNADFNKYQIGLNVSPDYCYISISSIYEIPKAGLTTGLNAVCNFNKRVGLETGLHYSNKGFQTKMIDLNYFEPDPLAPTKAKFIYNLNFIDVPLKANFTFGSRKIRFFTSVGLTTNFLIKETQTNVKVYSDRTDIETINQADNGTRSVNLSPNLSFGIDYKLNDNSHLRVEPTFRSAIFKMVDTGSPGNLISAGLNISYYLGR